MSVKDWIKTTTIVLVLSVVLGGALTSYLDFYQQELLMPVRNLIVLGRLDKHDDEQIGLTRYEHGEGVSPVHVAQVGRSIALRILDGDEPWGNSLTEEDPQTLLTVADTLQVMGSEYEYDGLPFAVWWYRFDYPPLGLRDPWLSGMAQGHVIEVMLAAHRLTGDVQYLHTAQLAANTLAVPIDQGGAAVEIDGGGIWFEEYAQPGVPPPQVLNGHNFALSGLRYLCIEDTSYCSLYQQGVEGLRTLLPGFDAGFWSQYDLTGMPAPPQYHRLHIEQLEHLATTEEEEMFAYYADRFRLQLYLPLSAFYRLVVYHNRFLVFTFSLNVLGVAFIIMIIFLWSRKRSNRS